MGKPEDDIVGPPVWADLYHLKSLPDGVQLQKERPAELEQLLGICFVLVERLGGNQEIKFSEFVDAANAGAHLKLVVSKKREEVTLSAERGRTGPAVGA